MTAEKKPKGQAPQSDVSGPKKEPGPNAELAPVAGTTGQIYYEVERNWEEIDRAPAVKWVNERELRTPRYEVDPVRWTGIGAT